MVYGLSHGFPHVLTLNRMMTVDNSGDLRSVMFGVTGQVTA